MPILSSIGGLTARTFGMFQSLLNNSYESISTVTVGAGGVANVTFSSIPQDYKHLQIRGIIRSTFSGSSNNINIQFNGDTAGNYSQHYLYGDGTTPTFGVATASASITVARTPGGTATANVFGNIVFDILNYNSTNIYKTVRTIFGFDANGSGTLGLTSGNWRSTASISSIVIAADGASNIAQYSSFALYGIKG